MAKTLDLLLWGASSFTGALVAEYVASQYGNDTSVRIGLGGRTQAKLEAIRNQCETVCARAKVRPRAVGHAGGGGNVTIKQVLCAVR